MFEFVSFFLILNVVYLEKKVLGFNRIIYLVILKFINIKGVINMFNK